MHKVMVFGNGASGRWSGHEGGVTWMGLVPLYEEARELASSLSALWGHGRSMALYKLGRRPWPRTQSSQHWNHRLSASTTVRNKHLFFKPPILCYFVTTAWAKTILCFILQSFYLNVLFLVFVVWSQNHVRLFATLWTVACQASLSMGFSRQKYWSGLPFPSPGDLLDPGTKSVSLMSPAPAGRFFTTVPSGIFPDSSAGKESAWNVGDLGSIPRLTKSPGEGRGYPL